MTHRTGTLGMVLNDGKKELRVLKPAILVALSVVAIALVVASVYGLMTLLRPDAGSEMVAGVEASAARWVALGAAYRADASAARWNALGDSYLSKIATGAEVSAARWNAFGDLYKSKIAAGVETSSARYQAMADSYAAQAAAAR